MAKKQGCPVKLAANELLKWLIGFAVSFAVLAACICIYNRANAPVPGEVFTGRAQGMFCEIVAEVTVAEGRIVDVKLTGADETRKQQFICPMGIFFFGTCYWRGFAV